MQIPPISRARLAFLPLVAFGVLTGFLRLSEGSLRLWDEALTAERSREMLVLGDFVTPHLGFIPDFNKPPLYYALTAGLFALFGEGEGTARALSVVFALGCTVWVALLAAGEERRWVAGWLAALLLLTNPYWVNKTREALLDSGMLFGLLGAWWGLRRGWAGSPHGWWVAGVCAAIGCLVKGPLPLLAWPLAIAEVYVRRGKVSQLPWRPLLSSLLLACVLVVPWYAAQLVLHGPDWARNFFGYSMGGRFVRPIEGHEQPAWFYLAAAAQHAPVSLAATVLSLSLLRRCSAVASNTVQGPMLLLFATGFVLTAAASKRGAYLVYLAPQAAILGGVVFGLMQDKLSHYARTVGMWLLLGVSATGFFIGYKARMSYGREHKEAGLAVRPLVQRGTSLAFREVPAQAVLFYAGMLPQNGAEGSGILVFPLSHPSTPECGEIVFQGRTIEVRLCGAP